MSEMLKKARAYEAEKAAQTDKNTRPLFHISAPAGWINDPNGFSIYDGKIHLFYQYYPYAREWGPMHWGHSVTTDMISWEQLPAALAPDQDYDRIGCFSGSAIEADNKHVLVYTGVTKITLPDGREEERQNQCIAFGDGRDYVKYENNPVVTGEMLPENCSRIDFRDPKIWKEEDTYYLIVGSKDNRQIGQVVLCSSKDLKEWKFETVLAANSTGKVGTMWECPDFFPLDDKYVAMGAWMSHYDEYGRFQQCRYYVGDWNGDAMDVHTQQWVDFGSNCYAAQSFQHEDRRILIGWISDFYGEHIATEPGAYGSMTLPRELHVKNEHVYTKPVEEVYTLLGDTVYEGTGSEIKVGSIADNRYYASISFEETGDFNILLGQDGDKSISLTAEGGKVFFKMAGVKSDKIQFVSSVEKCRNAEIFVDGRTIEVYLNAGEDVGTRLFYNSNRQGIFCLNNEKDAQVKICEMKSIWK